MREITAPSIGPAAEGSLFKLLLEDRPNTRRLAVRSSSGPTEAQPRRTVEEPRWFRDHQPPRGRGATHGAANWSPEDTADGPAQPAPFG